MTRKPDIYNILGWLAMIAVPVSPAMFFGWKAYDALMVLTATGWLAVPGGVLTAFGLETVGIFAGHTAIDAYRRNDRRWKLAALIMLVYVVIGTWELWSNPIGRVTFIIAALVYLLAGLRHDLEETAIAEQVTAQKQEADEKAERNRREAWELEQAAKDREVERQLKLQTEADKTAVQLARIQAKKQVQVQTDNQTVLDTSKTDWRTLSDNQRSQIAQLTPEQIINQFNVSAKTAGRWLQKSGQLQPELSVNGHSNGAHK
jgi:hypothetical protein